MVPPPAGLAMVVWAKAGEQASPAAISADEPSRPIRIRRVASARAFRRAGEREPATGRLLEADIQRPPRTAGYRAGARTKNTGVSTRRTRQRTAVIHWQPCGRNDPDSGVRPKVGTPRLVRESPRTARRTGMVFAISGRPYAICGRRPNLQCADNIGLKDVQATGCPYLELSLPRHSSNEIRRSPIVTCGASAIDVGDSGLGLQPTLTRGVVFADAV